MQPVVTALVWSVCLLVTTGPPKMADPIEMLFGVWTWNLVLGGGSDPSRGRGSFLEGEVAARYKLYGHCIVS